MKVYDNFLLNVEEVILVYFFPHIFTDRSSDKENKQVTLSCIHLQGRCLDIADVAMRTGTLWVDALKASSRVDTSCPSATVVLLA